MNSAELEGDPKLQAEMRWMVNLDDVMAVRRKTLELTQNPATRAEAAELSNLFVEHMANQTAKQESAEEGLAAAA